MNNKSQKLKQIYNKIAADFHAHWASDKMWLSNASIQEFFKIVPRGAKVLDLGCGPGIQAKEMVKRGYQVVGIDFSEEMIKLARQNVKKAQFLVMDMTDLEFDDAEFDAVLAQASLLHIPKSKIESVLQGIARVMKLNAYLFISVKKGDGEIMLKEKNWYGVKECERFFALWQADELKSVLRQTGFEIILESENPGRTYSWLNYLVRKLNNQDTRNKIQTNFNNQ